MNKKISVFLPTRKGSERVINKNTRPIAGIDGGLLELKLQQLIDVPEVDEVILSTNDPDSVKVAHEFEEDKIKIIERPNQLALSSTDLQDLIEYAPTVCHYDHILWTHVTSPFTKSGQYQKAITEYFHVLQNTNFDSLMSGKWFQNFLWSPITNDIVNKNSKLKWPRTQDLNKWFEVDSAIFLASKNVYIEQKDRIGARPFLFCQDGVASFDIDWEDDFRIAEAIYKNEY